MIKTVTGLLAVLAVFGFCSAVAAEPPHESAAAVSRQGTAPRPPDIVWIVSDDQRRGLIDVMPAVQRELRDRGVQYVNAMVPTSICCPSRASMLTGMYSHGTGVWDNGLTEQTTYPGGNRAFVQNGNLDKTIAVALDDAGYRTGLIGKYLNQYGIEAGAPPGWDVWRPFEHGPFYYDYDLNGTHYGFDPFDYSTDVISRQSVSVIRNTDPDTPLFLFITPYGPHWPYTPAPRYKQADVDKFIHPEEDFGALNEPEAEDKPGWVQKLDPLPVDDIMAVATDQHRTVMAVDDLVNDVIAALRARSGDLQNTMVIYMSDNGYHWGDHRLLSKDTPYASATEIPMFIRYDPGLGSGIINSRLALNLDVTATVAQAAGVRGNMPWLEGESLLRPAVRGGFVLEGTFSNPHEPDFVERPPYCGWRTRDSLFVRYSTGFEEFYRYSLDPYERFNRIKVDLWKPMIDNVRTRARKHCDPEPPGFNWN